MFQKAIILILILFTSVNIAPAQEKGKKKIKLSGYIKDMNGNPVTEAFFFVDGVAVNTSPDQEGHYKFKIKRTSRTIALLTVSLGSVEMLYEGQDTINFTFQSIQTPGQGNIQNLDAVVDIGYGKVRERDLNADVSSINPEKINKFKYSNIYDMIKGELPGVIVSGTSIRIQGISSINASNQPLFLVNGMETEAIGFIRPDDVKSISVIKGPAASIYGSRGANGVIDIKLK